MHESPTPADELLAIMDGTEHVDIGLMDCRQVWIVEDEDVVGFNLASVTEALYDSFDGDAGAGHVPAGGFAGRENFAVGAIERRGIVLHLRGVYCAAHSFECDAGFLRERVQAV